MCEKDKEDKAKIINGTLGDFFIDDNGNYVYEPKVYYMGIHTQIKQLGNL